LTMIDHSIEKLIGRKGEEKKILPHLKSIAD
jgi:hypothetical protein